MIVFLVVLSVMLKTIVQLVSLIAIIPVMFFHILLMVKVIQEVLSAVSIIIAH